MTSNSLIPPGRLMYGMQLPISAKSPMFAQPWEQEGGRDDMEAIARLADRTGYFYLGVCDHVAIPRSHAAEISTVWFDSIATLGWLAGVTRSTRLLSHVYVLPYRNPLLSADAFMTLDELSAGRVIIGVGAGHLQEEFAALGVSYQERGQLADEAIDIIRAAWKEEYLDIKTPHWSFSDIGIAPRPRQAAATIWVGGSSRAALRRVATRGDGWLPEGTPRDQLPAALAYLQAQLDRIRPGQALDVGAGVSVYVGRPSWEVSPDTVTGEPDQIAADLRSLTPLGVNHVQLRFPSRDLNEQLEQIEQFGTDVGPHLN